MQSMPEKAASRLGYRANPLGDVGLLQFAHEGSDLPDHLLTIPDRLGIFEHDEIVARVEAGPDVDHLGGNASEFW